MVLRLLQNNILRICLSITFVCRIPIVRVKTHREYEKIKSDNGSPGRIYYASRRHTGAKHQQRKSADGKAYSETHQQDDTKGKDRLAARKFQVFCIGSSPVGHS